MKKDIIIINKDLIQKITNKNNLNEIHLHLDYDNCKVTYEEDYTDFSITWWLPYFYKIKMLLLESKIIKER